MDDSSKTGSKILGGGYAVSLIAALALRCAYAVRAGAVYAGAAASPQSISLSRFAQTFALKDAEALKLFTSRFLSKVIIGDTGLAAAVYACILLLVLLYFCLKMERKAEDAAIVLQNLKIGLLTLAVYIVMLYCTYLFTMTVNEMISVNSFYRYYGSMVIVFAGMTIYTALSCCACTRLGGEGTQRVFVLAMVLFAVMAMPGAYSKRYIWGRDKFFMPDHYGSSFWWTMEYNVPENRSYTDLRYAAFWDTADFDDNVPSNQYAEYALSAWLRSDQVKVISRSDLERGMSQEQIDAIEACDRLVFLSDMSDERELLSPYINTSDLGVGLKEK